MSDTQKFLDEQWSVLKDQVRLCVDRFCELRPDSAEKIRSDAAAFEERPAPANYAELLAYTRDAAEMAHRWRGIEATEPSVA